MADHVAVGIPLEVVVDPFQSFLVGGQILGPFALSVLVGQVAQRPVSHVRDFEVLAVDLEGVAFAGVLVTAVHLGDGPLDRHLADTFVRQDLAGVDLCHTGYWSASGKSGVETSDQSTTTVGLVVARGELVFSWPTVSKSTIEICVLDNNSYVTMTGTSTLDKREMIERWDTVFRSLAAEPRRQLVVSLMEAPQDRELSLPEAANPPSLLMEPATLYSELIHVHLPVLEDAGLIEWEREPLCAKRGPQFEEAATVIEAIQQNASTLPPSLREGCQRLEEQERRQNP